MAQIQKTPKKQQQTGWTKCAKIAKVLNLIFPILITIGLTIAIIVLVVQKNTKPIVPLVILLVIFLLLIALVVWLYNRFPAAMCVLFILNILFTIISIFFASKE